MSENNKLENIHCDNAECCQKEQQDSRFNAYSFFISRDGDWTAQQQNNENNKEKVYTK